MRRQVKHYIWAVSFVLALPLLALALKVPSSSGKNGVFRWFNVNGAEATIASGVNEEGLTVGTYHLASDSCGEIEHGFTTRDNGEHIRAINFPGAASTELSAISDEGTMAGMYETRTGTGCGTFQADHGFLLEEDEFETLELPNTVGIFPDVRGVNEDWDVVGGYTDETGDHGFLFEDDETFTVLEVCDDTAISSTPEGCKRGTTDGWGINEHKMVAGHYEDNNFNACVLDDGELDCENHHHGFTWTKKHGFKKLYCDGDPLSNTDANAINDDRVIVGRCDSSAFALLPPYRNVDCDAVTPTQCDWYKFSIPEPAVGKFRCPTGAGWELNSTVAWAISNEGKIVGSYTCENDTSGDEQTFAFTTKLKDVVHK